MRFDRPPLSYVPLLPILVGIVAGVLCGRFLDVPVWIMAGGALLVAAVGEIFRLHLVAEVAMAMSLGVVSVSMAMPRQFVTLPDDAAVTSGRVTDALLLADCQRLRVHVPPDDGGASFDMLVTYPAFEPRIAPGDLVSFSGAYAFPRRLTDLPLENDMSQYYLNNGISMLCYAPKGRLEITGRSGNIYSAMLRWRMEMVDRLVASPLDERTASFLAAVLGGDDSLLAAGVREEYAAAGVSHLLALSGAHVAMIAMVLAILLFPLTLAGYRRARWWLTIAVLIGYMIFTGMSPSVCRAVIMASGVLLSLIFERPRSSLNLLCLAASVILVFWPLSLMSAGFQLSFAATLAIILFTPALAPVRVTCRRDGWIAGAIATTAAATAGTLPLVACHFHSVPVYFFIANIAAVAVMPVMIGGGVLLALLQLAGCSPDWLIWLLDNLYSMFDALVAFVAGMPHASVKDIYMNPWLLVPVYAALAFAVAWLYLRHRSYAALTCATLLFAVGVYCATRQSYPVGEAYMVRSHKAATIAVNRGDTLCFLTTSPRHNHSHDSARWSDRYRDYIATRGLRHIVVLPLDSTTLLPGSRLRFGGKDMVIAHALPHNPGVEISTAKVDYCLLTARWYGKPVELYGALNVDTMVVSMDMNSRRRRRYVRELTAAGIPVIDLAARPLMSY